MRELSPDSGRVVNESTMILQQMLDDEGFSESDLDFRYTARTKTFSSETYTFTQAVFESIAFRCCNWRHKPLYFIAYVVKCSYVHVVMPKIYSAK